MFTPQIKDSRLLTGIRAEQYGVIGMELFIGILSRRCIEPGMAGSYAEAVECPQMLSCPHQCYIVDNNETDVYMSQDRMEHRSHLGFDNIFNAILTQFGGPSQHGPSPIPAFSASWLERWRDRAQFPSHFQPDLSGPVGPEPLTFVFFPLAVMILDQWSLFMHPIRDSAATTNYLAFPIFAVMVVTMSMVTVNLFRATCPSLASP